jgi:uncharacterized protein involved in type VI secretion and phage assembly
VDLALFDLMENGSGSRENRIEGIVLGIVTNNRDELKLGRVKIKFPWSVDGDETQWARVATFMAGKDMGAFFLPEVGDEVIVAFDHGDINHPYVLGSLWNGKKKPPIANDDGQNDIRMLKSRSGHQVTFNDGEGAEKVEVRTKSGHTILLDDSSGKENITIRDKSGNTIQIDSVQNAITIQSSTKLILKAKDMELASDGRLSIKAKGDLSIKGAMVKIN